MRPTDAELLEQWRTARDAGALAELVSRHSAMVYGASKRILGDSSRAEEAAKSCFEALAATGPPVKRSAAGWLHRASVQHSLERLEGAGRGRRAMRSEEEGGASELSWKQLGPQVDEVLDALPDRLREAAVLRFLEALPQSDIAQDLGISRTAVEYRLAQGVERMAKALSKGGMAVAAPALSGLLAANGIEATPAGLAAALAGLDVPDAGSHGGPEPADAGRPRRFWRNAALVGGLVVLGLTLALGVHVNGRQEAGPEAGARSAGLLEPAVAAPGPASVPDSVAGAQQTGEVPEPAEEPGGDLLTSLLEAMREHAAEPGAEAAGKAAKPLASGDIPPENGAHYFLLAAELLPKVDAAWLSARWEEIRRHGWSEDPELRAFLEECRPAIEALRNGLAAGHAFLPAPGSPNEPMPYLTAYRDLAKVMAIEAQMYAGEGDYAAALDNYLTVLDFAAESARGGVMVNGLVSYSISEEAAQGVREILDWAGATPEDYRAVIERMQRLDERTYAAWEMASAEAQIYSEWMEHEAEPGPELRQVLQATSHDAIMNRVLEGMSDEEIETAFRETLAQFPSIIEYLSLPYYEAQETDPNALAPNNVVNDLLLWALLSLHTSETRVRAVVRGDMLMAAVLLYYLENGSYPASLDDLTPGYLAVVPVDPFSGGVFAYTPTNFGYLLFSAGADRKNNRGVMDAWDTYGADLVLHRK